ncbi:flagellar biosynthesis protein FlhF [Paenibacillus harenae]|uniref:Flagellar biosynthesis protein FlhF n=1 Tax=Paenibacillus harenae TaxID=306543 RepID=A0ABT9U262_PAEHA|nr:flagellar biosynthesis protein FlhF [Paenibacillus harenae]MDQ0113093.1 flagellar biosynthesis protein FlhF [Paenibacillus harenae]
MRVKRYVVDALPEAVSMIRTELGKDAVILNTKELKIGGFMGMFRKKKIEVIAAIESAPANAAPQRQASPEVNAAAMQILQSMQRSSAAALDAESPVIPPIPAPAPAPPAQNQNENLRVEREQFIINEIRDLRQYMVQLSKQQKESSLYSEQMLELKERLIDQEMSSEWIDRLMQAVHDKQTELQTEFAKDQLWSEAAKMLEEWIRPFVGHAIDPDARVVHFVGPTGVGKTTTIAKLAAEQTIKFSRKVGFITSDTYRIAAVDQLRTYANILNIPLEVVVSQPDLTKAYKQLSDRELIYMDTAGRNFRSELHVSEVNSLLQSKESSETILVLSLTAKTKDMAAVAEQFAKYGVRKVLFTKLDETSVYGSIFNLIMNFELLPTYLAAGQTVPDDIERFRVQTYIQLLLGDSSHE